MATTTTIAATKRAFLAEISALSITSATAARPALVQTSYARPPADQQRAECVYFTGDAYTSDIEERMTSGRRKRFLTWEIELVVSSQIIADVADAERRAFEITDDIEDFLAANPQPAEWTVSPVATGAMYVRPNRWAVEHTETVEGVMRVDVTITLEMKERLI